MYINGIISLSVRYCHAFLGFTRVEIPFSHSYLRETSMRKYTHEEFDLPFLYQHAAFCLSFEIKLCYPATVLNCKSVLLFNLQNYKITYNLVTNYI